MESCALGPPALGFLQAMYFIYLIYYGADSGFSIHCLFQFYVFLRQPLVLFL